MQNLMNSILFNTDSYKTGMFLQYPENTKYVHSYIEARGDTDTLFFGLQSFIKNYLTTSITKEEVEIANKYWTAHGVPFNYDGWMYIVENLSGKLPISIKAPQEGLVIPSKNALVTVVNTDPKCYWLTTWIEGALLRGVWYPTTVASNSKKIKNLLKHYLEKSGDVSRLAYSLQDFGHRGCSSNETASLGSAANLVNFMGTDTYVGVLRLMQDYSADVSSTGHSIAASEHSTITSWGRDNEELAYENMINQFSKPGSIYAVVSDSYDIYAACKMWSTTLKEKVISSGGTLVIRPDSGDPIEVLPKMLHILDTNFGYTINDKGYKVLNHVKVIWGDGINYKSIYNILCIMVDLHGYSADNFAFGMGGALLGAPQRDDNKWAMKCSAIVLEDENGVVEQRDVFKDPITDSGKRSKAGFLKLVKNDVGDYKTIRAEENLVGFESVMDEVYRDGELLRDQTIEQIRFNSNL